MITTGRSGRVSRAFSQDRQPVEVGHAHVHHHDVHRERGDLLERLAPAARDLDRVPLHRERARERELDVPLVVDDEDRGGHGGMLPRVEPASPHRYPGWRPGRKSFDSCSDRSHLETGRATARDPTGGHMRRVLLLALTAAALATLAGCPAKPKERRVQVEPGLPRAGRLREGLRRGPLPGVRRRLGLQGRASSAATNRCVPKPQCAKDADCPEGQRCEGERCVARAGRGGDAPTQQDGRRRARRRGAVPAECADAERLHGPLRVRPGDPRRGLAGRRSRSSPTA